MQEMYVFNPRHCNSAITLSGCIEKNKSKVIITFPTSPDVIQLFEKTLIASFSWVNTGLALDREILLPNLSSKDFQKLNIDDSFKQQKTLDLKLIYRFQLDGEDSYNEGKDCA